MRILFFHRSPVAVGGGANQYVLDILPRIREAGHHVALVHARAAETSFRGTGYLLDSLTEPRPLSQVDRARIEAILDDFRPDVLQFHAVDNFYLDEFVRGKAPLARFVHNHDAYCSGGNMSWLLPSKNCTRPYGRSCLLHHFANLCGSANPVVNVLRHRATGRMLACLHAANSVQTLSAEVAKNLRRNGIPDDKIVLLPPPVPAPPFRPPQPRTSGRRFVLHVGGLLSKKGIWVAIRTLRALPADCDLVFAGGGAERSRVEEHIRHRGLGDRIRVFARLTPEEWARLYYDAEMVIMPCIWNEPLGLGAMRANAYGRPVVAFDTGGVAAWLKDGVNGRLIPMRQRNDFQKVVRELLDNPDELAKLGESSLSHWEKHGRIEAHLTALLSTYSSLIASK